MQWTPMACSEICCAISELAYPGTAVDLQYILGFHKLQSNIASSAIFGQTSMQLAKLNLGISDLAVHARLRQSLQHLGIMSSLIQTGYSRVRSYPACSNEPSIGRLPRPDMLVLPGRYRLISSCSTNSKAPRPEACKVKEC